MSVAEGKYTWSHALSLQYSFDVMVYDGKEVAVRDQPTVITGLSRSVVKILITCSIPNSLSCIAS